MKKIIFEWKKSIFLLLLIILVGFFVRFYNLILLPVFADEAIYVRWSQIMANEATLRFLPLSDGKQPLYMWVLMFLVKHFSDPLFIGRLVSVVCGLGTIIGVFSLSYLIFKSKKVSLLASLFYSLSPFAVFFDRMALVDSMLTMLGVWYVFFVLLTFKTRRLDWAMITGFILGLMFLTKSNALFFLLITPLILLMQEKKYFFKYVFFYFVLILISFGMYNILRLGPNFHLLKLRTLDYVYPYSHFLASPLDPFIGHIKGIFSYFVLLFPLSLSALSISGILVNFKKNFKKILPLLIFAIIPILVTAEFSKTVTARYVFYTVPFFVILASSVFLSKQKIINYVMGVLMIIFVIQSVLFDYKLLTNVEAAPLPYGDRSGYLEEWSAGQGLKEISEYIKNEAKNLSEGQKIVIGTEGYFGTLPQGLEIYLQNVPNVLVIGVGLELDKTPKSLVESSDSGNKTYLVANKSRLFKNYEDIPELKLVKSYDKPQRRLGSREYQMYGPRESLYLFEVYKVK